MEIEKNKALSNLTVMNMEVEKTAEHYQLMADNKVGLNLIIQLLRNQVSVDAGNENHLGTS